jgi:chromate transport protein ChrA
MAPRPDNTLTIVAIGIVIVAAWYVFQIASRKKKQIRYKVRKLIIAIAVYLFATMMLSRQGIASLQAVMLGGLAGFACAEILVSAPKRSRCIPPAIRREVIARDLTSKGLKWDRTKHHIDHIGLVPKFETNG